MLFTDLEYKALTKYVPLAASHLCSQRLSISSPDPLSGVNIHSLAATQDYASVLKFP